MTEGAVFLFPFVACLSWEQQVTRHPLWPFAPGNKGHDLGSKSLPTITHFPFSCLCKLWNMENHYIMLTWPHSWNGKTVGCKLGITHTTSKVWGLQTGFCFPAKHSEIAWSQEWNSSHRHNSEHLLLPTMLYCGELLKPRRTAVHKSMFTFKLPRLPYVYLHTHLYPIHVPMSPALQTQVHSNRKGYSSAAKYNISTPSFYRSS